MRVVSRGCRFAGRLRRPRRRPERCREGTGRDRRPPDRRRAVRDRPLPGHLRRMGRLRRRRGLPHPPRRFGVRPRPPARHQRELGGCQCLRRLVEPQDAPPLPSADGTGMGVCRPRRRRGAAHLGWGRRARVPLRQRLRSQRREEAAWQRQAASVRRRLHLHVPRRLLRAQRVRPLRHDRQRLAVDGGLLDPGRRRPALRAARAARRLVDERPFGRPRHLAPADGSDRRRHQHRLPHRPGICPEP